MGIEDGSIRKARPSIYLFRAAASFVHGYAQGSLPEKAARSLFGSDPVTAEILKAATGPATTTQTGWAAELARLAIQDMIAAVASLSAGADLITRATIVPFDGFANIRVPGRAFAANNQDAGQWVAEDAPIPNRQLSFTGGLTLAPRKLAVLVSFTREMSEASAIEAISRAMISEAVGLALDAQIFSATAGDATKPPGLLVGVTPIVPTTTTGNITSAEAAALDIGNLVAALAANHGGKTPLFIAAPKQAVALKLFAGPHFDYPIIASASLAAGTIIAIEMASFISAWAPEPEFSTTKAATIHAEDTAPTDITGGTPSPAVPVRSYFQTDSIGLKMVLRASWGMRASGHVQVVTGTNW